MPEERGEMEIEHDEKDLVGIYMASLEEEYQK